MVISDPLLIVNVIRRMLSANFTTKMAYAHYVCHL